MDIKKLIAELTLEEKAGLCSGEGFWYTKAVDRLGIPHVMVTDGPHGLRKQQDAADNLGINQSVEAVCFPSAAGVACSFDTEMMRDMGETLGNECQAENVSILLGPAVNIKRSPLCGRNFEYFSEDPYLAGEMAASYIQGVQSKHVGTSMKHFAANNQECRRLTISSVVDERTLREIYLPAFEIAVKKAQPSTLMCSYNKINGTYSAENKWLLTDVLRKEWGFKGYVMTDWGAMTDNRPKALEAGLELEMPSSGGINDKLIVEAVNAGVLDEKILDHAVELILTEVYRYVENRDEAAVFDRESDHRKAVAVARETQVLLKNNGVLPLKKEAKVAFIGAFAKEPRYQGGGSSHINAHRVVGAWESANERGIKNVSYAQGYQIESGDRIDEHMLQEAVETAQKADVAVIFAGLPASFESEGYDRTHLHMPKCQNVLIHEICKVQKNVVVVLHNGSPVLMPWADGVSAILESYLGGEGVGEAQIDLLYGECSPSAKLAETFPKALTDTPCYGNYPGGQMTVEYREGLYVGYRYYDTVQREVLFPFGHGLTYTTFEYSELKTAPKVGEKDGLSLSVKVKNTGSYDAAEIIQVYVAPPKGRVYRPVHELKAFARVFLKAGEEKTIELAACPRAFEYYDTAFGGWRAESGTYTVEIGASSRDIRLMAEVEVVSDSPDFVPEDRSVQLPDYYTGNIKAVTNDEFTALIGHTPPSSERDRTQPITANNSLSDASDTKWGARIDKLLRTALLKRGGEMANGAMMYHTVMEMPVRGFRTMSGGLVSQEMIDALVSLLNGQGGGGRLVKEGIGAVKALIGKK